MLPMGLLFSSVPCPSASIKKVFFISSEGICVITNFFDTPYSFSYLNLELHHKEKKNTKKPTPKKPNNNKNQANKQTNKTKPCAKAELESLDPVQIFSPSPTCFLANGKM